MSSVDEITDAIRKLSADELTALRVWLAEYDAARWDIQFEEDVAQGRLDAIADEAIQSRRAT